MGLRYYKLFDMLQRREMKKGDLMESAGLSWPTMSKLSKGQAINSEIIERICLALGCQPGDIMEFVPDASPAMPGGTNKKEPSSEKEGTV